MMGKEPPQADLAALDESDWKALGWLVRRRGAETIAQAARVVRPRSRGGQAKLQEEFGGDAYDVAWWLQERVAECMAEGQPAPLGWAIRDLYDMLPDPGPFDQFDRRARKVRRRMAPVLDAQKASAAKLATKRRLNTRSRPRT